MSYDHLTATGSPPGVLRVSSSQCDDRMAFVLAGELDIGNAAAVQDVLTQALEHRDRMGAPLHELIVDLRQLEFLDACGIRALIAARRSCRRHGTRLSLRLDDGSPARRILDLAGVADYLFCRD